MSVCDPKTESRLKRSFAHPGFPGSTRSDGSFREEPRGQASIAKVDLRGPECVSTVDGFIAAGSFDTRAGFSGVDSSALDARARLLSISHTEFNSPRVKCLAFVFL